VLPGGLPGLHDWRESLAPHRFQAILTDQSDEDIAVLERHHRQRAQVEDRIRDDEDTGLAKLPFKEFALNEVWLEIVLLAHDLIVWTQALLLDGELAKAEPKRLRYRLLHVAGRLAFSGRRAKLHLQRTWPWVNDLVAAFDKRKGLAATAGWPRPATATTGSTRPATCAPRSVPPRHPPPSPSTLTAPPTTLHDRPPPDTTNRLTPAPAPVKDPG